MPGKLLARLLAVLLLCGLGHAAFVPANYSGGVSIQTSNNVLQILVPEGVPAQFVFLDTSGRAVGQPVNIASLTDISNLQNMLLSAINNLNASIEARVAAMVQNNRSLFNSIVNDLLQPGAPPNPLQAALGNLSALVSSKVSLQNLAAIDAEVVTVVNNMVAAGAQNNLATQLQNHTASIAALKQQSSYFVDTRSLSAIDGEVVAVVNNMVAPGAQNNLSSQLQNHTASILSLKQQSSYFVDTRALSSIDGEIVSVVSSMATALPTSNSLAAQLSTKLNASQTCQCFNPSSLVALNTSLALSVMGVQQQTAYFVDVRNLSVLNSYVRSVVNTGLQCNSAPPTVTYGTVASCAGTFSGFTCAPTCASGYFASSTYSCAAGSWLGSPACLRTFPRHSLCILKYVKLLYFFPLFFWYLLVLLLLAACLRP